MVVVEVVNIVGSYAIDKKKGQVNVYDITLLQHKCYC